MHLLSSSSRATARESACMACYNNTVKHCSSSYFFSIVASPPSNVTITASGNIVIVTWSISSSGDDVTGYVVYYHHPNDETIVNKSLSVNSDTFTEHNATQRVYAVSVQALSKHLPSAVSGPVTVRGQLV